jgi:hypothetical protein
VTEDQLIAIYGKAKVELAKAMANPVKNCRVVYPPARKKVVIGWR